MICYALCVFARWSHDAELDFTEFCEAVLRVALVHAATHATREDTYAATTTEVVTTEAASAIAPAATDAGPARAAVAALHELLRETCSKWGPAHAATERAADQIEHVRVACRRAAAACHVPAHA